MTTPEDRDPRQTREPGEPRASHEPQAPGPAGARRPLPARLLGFGARGAERVAAATGIDDAVETATEEAIVRALESPAVERAIARVLESEEVQVAFERALASEAVERAVVKVLDSQLVDHVWERVLASDEAQKLVERIAEAPEVRAAIAQQGFGLLEDIGRQIREIADRFDDALERAVRRITGRAQREGPPRNVGIVTRAVAAAVDGGILNLLFLSISAIFGVTIGGVLGDDQSPAGEAVVLGSILWLLTGAGYLGFFWGLSGQTPGMRLLSIRLDADGDRHIGGRRAVRRLVGTALSIASFGVGFLVTIFDERRRSWADRLAGTVVVEEEVSGAPHSHAPAVPRRADTGL